MRWMLAVTIAVLLLAGAASAHRMFVGQQVTVDLFVFYDDGSPAANAEVRLYQDKEFYAQNITDSTGRFTVTLPGKGTGKWHYEVEGGGHAEKGYINIDNNPPHPNAPAQNATARAGFYSIILLLPYISQCRKREKI